MQDYKPPLSRLEKKLENQQVNLERLETELGDADNDKSRSSFRGKITRCKKNIEALEAQIERLYPTKQ